MKYKNESENKLIFALKFEWKNRRENKNEMEWQQQKKNNIN